MSTAEILAKYPHFHFTYCLNCKQPMYGEERPCEQPDGSTWTCGHCGAVNAFRNSIEPVELKYCLDLSFPLSNHTANKEESISDPQVPSSTQTLSGR